MLCLNRSGVLHVVRSVLARTFCATMGEIVGNSRRIASLMDEIAPATRRQVSAAAPGRDRTDDGRRASM